MRYNGPSLPLPWNTEIMRYYEIQGLSKNFQFTSLQLVLSSVKRLVVLQHSADYFLFPLG